MPQAPARGNGGIVNPNAPIIFSPSMGLGAPTFTTRSVGTRLVLRDALGASSADYALGLESGSLWLGVGDTSARFKLYFGTSACYTFAPQNMTMFLTTNRTLEQGEVAGVGDLPSGVYVGSQGSGGISLIPSANSSTAGAKVVVGAHNGSAWRSMVEASNVASGEPNLLLAKSGGGVIVAASSGLAGSALDVNGLTRLRGGVVESGVTERTSGSSYTMVSADRFIAFLSGSSGTLTLISSPDLGRTVDVWNESGGNITISPASGTINGAASLVLATGSGVTLRSFSNWYAY